MQLYRVVEKNTLWGTTDNLEGLRSLCQYLMNSTRDDLIGGYTIYARGDNENYDMPLIDYCKENNIVKQSFEERMNS